MEKREELKDGVKQRLIEFMAEQITKEESFIALKSELIEELLTKKEVQSSETSDLSETFGIRTANSNDAIDPITNEEEIYKNQHGFVFNKEAVEKRLEKLKGERDSFGAPSILRPIKDSTTKSDIISDLKSGSFTDYLDAMKKAEERRKNFSSNGAFQIPVPKDRFLKDNRFTKDSAKNIIESIKQGKVPTKYKGFTEDMSDSPDLSSIVKKLNENNKYDTTQFEEYSFKYNYSEIEKISFRKKILALLKSGEIKVNSNTFYNENNYYRKYSATNSKVAPDAPKKNSDTSINDFILNISFVYNDINKTSFIDNFSCLIDSRYMSGQDLGLPFAVEILSVVNEIEGLETTVRTKKTNRNKKTSKTRKNLDKVSDKRQSIRKRK